MDVQNNDVSVAQEIEVLAIALAQSRKTNAEWLRENGPGGWIDELRHEVTALRERNAFLQAAMLEAEGSLRCADVQSIASDDQIIMGRVREAATVLRTALRGANAARAATRNG